MEVLLASLGALCCVFAVVAVITVIAVRSFGGELQAAPGRLGGEMGLQQVVARKGMSRGDWYGGQLEGRPFALTYVSQKVRGANINADTRKSTIGTLRIAMPVSKPGGDKVDVRRMVQATMAPQTFEDAFFKTKGIEQIGPNGRQALWDFVQAHGAIRVKDWASHPRQTMPAELGFSGEWVIYHDHFGTDQTPEVAWAKVQALHQLALALESE